MPLLDESDHREVIFGYDATQWKPVLDLIPQIDDTETFRTAHSSGYFLSASIVNDFQSAAYAIPIVVNFAWPKWDEGKTWMRDATFDYDTLDLADKCKVLTLILRAERFNEGLLPRKFEDGTIQRILHSIKAEVDHV